MYLPVTVDGRGRAAILGDAPPHLSGFTTDTPIAKRTEGPDHDRRAVCMTS